MDTAQGPTNWLVSIDQDTNATQHVTIENLKMDSNMVSHYETKGHFTVNERSD